MLPNTLRTDRPRLRRLEPDTAGLADLVGFVGRHGAGEVAIERPDGPVIDVLLDAGLTVVVISPNQVKHLRRRHGSAGEQGRPPRPSRCAAPAAIKHLVNHRVATAKQLRAHNGVCPSRPQRSEDERP